jgi:hypothetical protein
LFAFGFSKFLLSAFCFILDLPVFTAGIYCSQSLIGWLQFEQTSWLASKSNCPLPWPTSRVKAMTVTGKEKEQPVAPHEAEAEPKSISHIVNTETRDDAKTIEPQAIQTPNSEDKADSKATGRPEKIRCAKVADEVDADLQLVSKPTAAGVCCSSGFRGVTANGKKWAAKIGMAGNYKINLGTFCTKEEAARVYDMKAREYKGRLAVCNFDSDEEAVSTHSYSCFQKQNEPHSYNGLHSTEDRSG